MDSLWPLLKGVSRSFYLSLRYLPNEVRLTLSLAYLLARLTDTLADLTVIPKLWRRERLKELSECIKNPYNGFTLDQFQGYLHDFEESEQRLIEHTSLLLQLLKELPSQERQWIQDVLKKIIEGQLIDLNFFDESQGLVHFSTDAELDNYLYLVAGCVGEFWTQLCCYAIPDYAKVDLEDLLPKAVNFGKALQLTNILRDLPKDLNNGRLYLPYPNAPSVNNLIYELSTSSLIEKWRQQALEYLKDAADYIHVLNQRRVKFACIVPYLIAQDTLHAIKNVSYISEGPCIKIPRKKVYLHIGKALYQCRV